VPTVTLSLKTMQDLNLSAEDLRTSPLAGRAKTALEAILTSRGFDMTKPIQTVELATGGFVLTQ
jgi:hypothetical protein